MKNALFRLFRFFVTEFGIAAFLTVLHGLLVVLYWFYPHAAYSSWLLIPDTLFREQGFPEWYVYAGWAFFLCVVGRILSVILANDFLALVSTGISFALWLGVYFAFQCYYLIYAKLPVSEWYFSSIVIYANAMVFLRQCLGFKPYFKMTKDGKEQSSVAP